MSRFPTFAIIISGILAVALACGGDGTPQIGKTLPSTPHPTSSPGVTAFPQLTLTPTPISAPTATPRPTPTTVPVLEPTLEPTLAPTPTLERARSPVPTLNSDAVPLDVVVQRGETPFVSGPGQMQPGQATRFTLGVLTCCVFVEEVAARTVWSSKPESGAAINPETGEFRVDPETVHGTVFTILADVEEGRFLLTTEVNVFNRDANPLVGLWREQETGNVNELIFQADGRFTVTWFPFEVYKDYWGDYTFELGSPKSGSIELHMTGGNRSDIVGFQGSGAFAIDRDGILSLNGVYLGKYDSDTGPTVNCGHRFAKP